MAQKIYYVDFTNGDDGNDGTAPDKAWKTPFVSLSDDQSSVDEPALIYVRRNDEISLDDIDISDNPNRIIVGWPIEGEEYWDNRPDDGKDWDDDDDKHSKIIFNKSINSRVTFSNKLYMYNLDIETSDDSTDECLLYSIGDIKFVNCSITHQRNDSSDNFISLKRVDETKGTLTITVKDCEIKKDGDFISDKNDETWSECPWEINLYNSIFEDIDGSNAIIYVRASKINSKINVDNCRFDLKSTRLCLFNEDNDNLAVINVTINKIKFIGNSRFLDIRRRYKIKCSIQNSFISISDNIFLYVYHYKNVGEEYKTELNINNTVIESCSNLLYCTNYNSDYHSALGDVNITNCKISSGDRIFYMYYGVNLYTKTINILNTEINANNIFYSERNVSVDMFLNIKNSNIRSFCIKNLSGNLYLIANNSSFNALSNDSNVNNAQYILSNCSVVGGTHNSDYIIMHNGSIGGPLNQCVLDATNVQANIGENINGVIKNSRMSSLPEKTTGILEVFSSSANDEPVPYAKITPLFNIFPSNIIRVNGGNGSFKISSISKLPGFSLDRITVNRPANKNTVTFYLSSQSQIVDNFSFQASIYYEVDNNGYSLVSNIETTQESEEEWSGLYNGYSSRKLVFAFPDLGDESFDIVFSIQAMAKELKNVPAIYFDLKPKWDS